MPPKSEKQPEQPRKGKRTELQRFLEQQRPAVVGTEEWNAMRAALAPVSDAYLRRLLKESGVPLHVLVEGVRQEDEASLERTLTALLHEYEGGEQRQARRLVIEAKEHARFALKKHPEKQEMILWMVTWLENPSLFPRWVELRKEALLAENTGS
ncbi:MAG: hypothetical protein ABI811_19655 [Acidobacteriota bacterium]